MRIILILLALFLLTALLTGFIQAVPDDEKTQQAQNFYQVSLHATNRGIGFIYSKDHGGL